MAASIPGIVSILPRQVEETREASGVTMSLPFVVKLYINPSDSVYIPLAKDSIM